MAEPKTRALVLREEEAAGASEVDVPGWSVAPPRQGLEGTALAWLAGAFLGGLAAGLSLQGAKERGRLALAAGVGLAGLGLLRRPHLWFAPRYEIPQLNASPVELPVEEVGDHGTVHRGRIDVPQAGGGERPYLWIWLVPAAGNPCEATGSYRWYQYVRLRLTLDGQPKRLRKPIVGATGLKYWFDAWNADYHEADTTASDPALIPPGLNLDAQRPGKPFRHYDIPGTRTAGGTSTLTGVLDAPNFCARGDQTHSPAEQLLERFFPAGGTVREQADRPPVQVVRMGIEIEGRTYLACVANGAANCIGRIEWTYRNDIDIALVWREQGVALGTARRWRLGSEIRRCALSMRIGDWVQPC